MDMCTGIFLSYSKRFLLKKAFWIFRLCIGNIGAMILLMTDNLKAYFLPDWLFDQTISTWKTQLFARIT